MPLLRTAFTFVFALLMSVQVHAQSASFPILEFVVEGNTVLDEATIHEALYPHMGESRTLQDVNAARTSLEQAYQKRGYQTVGVDIPPQEVRDGIVRLSVVEGRVDRLSVRGAQYTAPSVLREKTAEFAPGTVPNLADASQQLASVNTATTEVTPGLKPGRTPGTVDVELNVKDRLPVVFTAELNNYRTANTEALRTNFGVRYTNLWQAGHQIGLNYLTAPQRTSQVQVWSANYLWPLAFLPGSLVFYAVDSDSATPSAIGGTTVLGAQRIYGARLIRLLRPAFDTRHWLTFGVDYKGLEQQDFRTLNYYPFTLGYTAQRTVQRRITSLDLSTVFSIREFGNEPNAFADRRFQGDSSFVAIKWDAQHEEPIGSWSLRGRFAGQTTAQPLVQSEQYAIGGSSSVRGYLEVEQFGDRAFIGSLEARSPVWKTGPDQWTVQAIGFLDAGGVYVVQPLPGQRASTHLGGVGVGARFRLGKQVNAAVDFASALRTTSLTKSGDLRLHGRINFEY